MGFFDILGKVLKTGGMAANMAGQPYVGVPLSVAGGAMEGGSQGGIGGALQGGITSGASAAAPIGLNKVLEGVKAGQQEAVGKSMEGLFKGKFNAPVPAAPTVELPAGAGGGISGSVSNTIGGQFTPMAEVAQRQAQGAELIPGWMKALGWWGR